MRGRRERAVAAAAAATSITACVEPYPAATMGAGLLAGTLPGGLPIRFPRVSLQ